MRNIGDKMAEGRFGPASRGITDYMQGGAAPGSPSDMFTMEADQSDYLEMLARLLDDDEFKKIVAGWHGGDESAYANEPMYGAASARGKRKVPSYVDPYTERTKRY